MNVIMEEYDKALRQDFQCNVGLASGLSAYYSPPARAGGRAASPGLGHVTSNIQNRMGLLRMEPVVTNSDQTARL